MLCERLLFWGVYQAIQVGSLTADVGRATLRDIEFATFCGFTSPSTYTGGIHVVAAQDVTIDNCNFYVDLLQGNPNQQTYIQNNAFGLGFVGANVATVTNCSVLNASVGMVFTGNYPSQGGVASSRLKVLGATFEGVGNGLQLAGTNIGLIVSGITCLGLGNSGGGSAINVSGSSSGTILDVDDFYLTFFPSSLVVWGDATGELRFGPNARFDNWNQNGGGGSALNAIAGAHVYYSTISLFTNGGGAPQTGGGGTFSTY